VVKAALLFVTIFAWTFTAGAFVLVARNYRGRFSLKVLLALLTLVAVACGVSVLAWPHISSVPHS
jgi:hypothetical protein